MAAVSLAHKIAAALAGLYGLAALVGGIIGFVKANSLPSLLAGGISGVLLLVCAVGIFRRPTVALFGSALIALALLAFFLPKALQPPSEPAKEGATARAIGMSIGAGMVLLSSALALGGRSGKC